MNPSLEDIIFLQHFGVKGMQWGVRKTTDSKVDSEEPKKTMSKQKKMAIVLGSAVVAASIAAGGLYVKKRLNGSVKNLPKPTKTVKKFTDSLANEPMHIVHSSRGRNRGYTFLRDGGVKDPEGLFAGLGSAESGPGFFKRFGKDNENVVARFLDPEGRKDFSGRPIGHDVILPRSMAKDVHNADDVAKVAWPHIKDLFAAYYRSEQGTYGPGF